jgi:hypothetical protein
VRRYHIMHLFFIIFFLFHSTNSNEIVLVLCRRRCYASTSSNFVRMYIFILHKHFFYSHYCTIYARVGNAHALTFYWDKSLTVAFEKTDSSRVIINLRSRPFAIVGKNISNPTIYIVLEN